MKIVRSPLQKCCKDKYKKYTFFLAKTSVITDCRDEFRRLWISSLKSSSSDGENERELLLELISFTCVKTPN